MSVQLLATVSGDSDASKYPRHNNSLKRRQLDRHARSAKSRYVDAHDEEASANPNIAPNTCVLLQQQLEQKQRRDPTRKAQETVRTVMEEPAPADVADHMARKDVPSPHLVAQAPVRKPSVPSAELLEAHQGSKAAQDDSPHGPLPDWAYFYDPALSYAQVKYIESQMKPPDEYSKIPPHRRQSIVANDLQQALSSMRQVYGRSTEVLTNSTHNAPGATSPKATIKHGQVQSLHHQLSPGNDGKDTTSSRESTDDDNIGLGGTVDRNRKHSTSHTPSKQATHGRTPGLEQTKLDKPAATIASPSLTTPIVAESPSHEYIPYSPPRQTRGEPEDNVARLSGSYVHGKRSANSDDVRPKRQRLLDHQTLEVGEDGRARIVSSPFHMSRPAESAHNSEPPLRISTSSQTVTSARSDLPSDFALHSAASLSSSASLETSDDDESDEQHMGHDSSRGRKWSKDDIERLFKVHAEAKTWTEAQKIFPKYSVRALRHKFVRLTESGQSQPVSNSSSTIVGDTAMRADEDEPKTALATMPVDTSRSSELRDKKSSQNEPRTRENSTPSQPRHDNSLHSSRSQTIIPVNGLNVGAARKGGVVNWFDEEIQLLLDLKTQDKSWDEIFEAIPRHTCAAIRTKHSNIRQDPRWAAKARQGAIKTPNHVDSDRPVTSDLIEKNGHVPSSSERRGASLDQMDTQARKPRARWTLGELEYIRKVERQGIPWQEITQAIPRHSDEGIRQKYWEIKVARSKAEGISRGGNKSGSQASDAEPKANTRLDRLRRKNAGKWDEPREAKAYIADPSGRSYDRVLDKFGRQSTSRLLLPGNYNATLSDLPGLPWVCPIRSCRYAFLKPSSLDTHWARTHRKCLLNDNNDGTFSIKGEYQPKKMLRTANALVISQNSLDPQETPMAETRSYRQVQLEMAENQPRAGSQMVDKEEPEEQPKSDDEVDGDTSYSRVTIPTDLIMATDIRSYREWPDHTGTLAITFGVPLPANYRPTEYRGFEWLCPLRTCGRIVSSLKSLGAHFSSGHPGILLNDNRDGTFTEVGHYTNREDGLKRRPAVVKSKIPLGPDAPPRAKPNASPWSEQRQLDLAASVAEWEQRKLTNPVQTKPTVDEVLSGRGSSSVQAVKADTDSSELSDAITPPGYVSPEPEVASTGGSELAEADELVDNESDGVPSDTLELMTPIARENWSTIRDLFTDKNFPPPQSGPLKELIMLRRVREIEINPAAVSKFYIQWPKDVSLLIVQLVGRESPTTCKRCERGYGIFSSCVVVSQDVANALQSGVCACVNCSWKSANHRKCDLKKLLKDVAGAAILNGARPPSGAVDAADHNVRHDSSDDGDSDSDQPVGPRRLRRPLMNDENDSNQRRRSRRSEELQGNDTRENGRAHQAINTTVSPAEDMGTSNTAAAVRKTTHTLKVDDSFSFYVDVIPPGTTFQLEPDGGNLRICSLAMGRVGVKVQGEQTFDIGPQGMFRLLPGVEAEIRNSAGFDAVLHVSSFKGR